MRGFLDLAWEQLTKSDFSDKKRFREVVQMLKNQIQQGIFQQGHTVVAAASPLTTALTAASTNT